MQSLRQVQRIRKHFLFSQKKIFVKVIYQFIIYLFVCFDFYLLFEKKINLNFPSFSSAMCLVTLKGITKVLIYIKFLILILLGEFFDNLMLFKLHLLI